MSMCRESKECRERIFCISVTSPCVEHYPSEVCHGNLVIKGPEFDNIVIGSRDWEDLPEETKVGMLVRAQWFMNSLNRKLFEAQSRCLGYPREL